MSNIICHKSESAYGRSALGLDSRWLRHREPQLISRCSAREELLASHMEALRSSLASHSDTANLLSKLRSSSLFGTGRSRAAVPRPSLEGSHRRRLRLAMGGCFPSCVAQEYRRAFAAAVRLAIVECQLLLAALASRSRAAWIACS